MGTPPQWEVIGGLDKGGIIVRLGYDLSAEKLPERLGTGAVLEEVDVVGARLHFRKITGNGPKTGWVSLRMQDKILVVQRPLGGD